MNKENENVEIIIDYATKVQETEEEIIFQTIIPFCSIILHKKISKKELKDTLIRGELMNFTSCEERMPDAMFGCLVTVMNSEPCTGKEFETILPYHVGYDGRSWNDADGKEVPFEVIAWMPLPEPYRGERGGRVC